MSRTINIFKGSSGLNTKLDPTRIKFDPRTGVSDLAVCVNIDIDDSGRISRRKGSTATSRTESWHSLFSCGAYALGISGNALAVLEPNMARTNIRNVTVGAKMSFVRDTDGTQDVIYYANGYQSGRVINKISYTWPLMVPVGATTIKKFYAPPLGHILEIYNARMFIAAENTIWYSEPNTYYAYRLGANSFRLPGRIRMIQAVSGGLWISDSESVYFLGGSIAPALQEMPIQIKKCDCPVIEGTNVEAPASRIGLDGLSGIVTIFTTTKGVCIGSMDGTLIPVTEHKVEIPSGLSGSAVYRDGKYIVTIN